MEEIREIALAYYKNMPEEQSHNAYQMFLAMDLNGDGRVTIDEYIEIFGELGVVVSNPGFIRELDRNGDGILDFEEFLSLYYLLKSGRLIFCDGHGCGAFLKGTYFTCVHCFSNDQNTTYDLCSSCFNNRNYHHHHDAILDNFTFASLHGGLHQSSTNGSGCFSPVNPTGATNCKLQLNGDAAAIF